MRTASILSIVLVSSLTGCGAFSDVSADGEGRAIKGYDPVSMRVDGVASEGEPSISTDYSGASWHFVSDAHRAAFDGDPEHFAPRFGGYCVVALADGMLVNGDPEAFVMHDDTLYLTLGRHAKTMFELDRDGYVRRATANWERLAPMREEKASEQ